MVSRATMASVSEFRQRFETGISSRFPFLSYRITRGTTDRRVLHATVRQLHRKIPIIIPYAGHEFTRQRNAKRRFHLSR